MLNLPINEVLPQVKEELIKSNRLVLQAPPGAGKTTALPLSLLDEPWLKDKQIIMLEPRRLAVRSSAARMAELLGEKIGETIGYQIKMESVQSSKTKILIVTEGILTRQLQSDPSLENIALVIFDEFHERSLHADLSLALCLESQALLREDLKLLIMSATLKTSAISDLLQGAPLIKSEGRSYPVEDIYLDVKTPQPSKKELPIFIYNLVQKVLKNEEGNILIFLPGIAEIKKLQEKLNEAKIEGLYVSALYGSLSKDEQDRAIKAPKNGFRKIVLSTNIAQTSLTIEGIKIVIDSGLQNLSIFNPSSGMNSLKSSFISQDSATQRAGRAGRLSEGKAYHLWHKGKILLAHDTPEILSSDLAPMLLELYAWGTSDISELQWMDLPSTKALDHAKELLLKLGSISKEGKISEHGRQMASFALHPRLAHMMIRAKAMGLSYEASLLSVLISEKDIYTSSYRSCDMRERVHVLDDVNRGVSLNSSHINIKWCQYLLKNSKRLEKSIPKKINLEMLGVLLAFAYPERIAQARSSRANTYLLSNARGAFLPKDDELIGADYLVVSELDSRAESAAMYKAAALSKAQIEEHLQELIEDKEVLRWNAQDKKIEARKLRSLDALILEETQMQVPSNEKSAGLLIEAIKEIGMDCFAWSKKASSFKERVNFVNHHHKGYFPNLEDKHLLETMHEWLSPYLEDKRSLKDVQELDMYAILSTLCSWEQIQELDKLAPFKMKVPSGSEIIIDYSDLNQPILKVRLQEMFGTKETPTVLGNEVKLMIHLLSPAHRPMQVTQDLENFWKTTYIEVKKELRGKYKRHYWPDDPLSAQATSKTKKNM